MPTQSEFEKSLPVRRELGAAMMKFVKALTENQMGPGDDVMRQVATEEYRQAVMHAADLGVEVALTWHTLGIWSEEGKDRIGAFSRALECLRQEKESPVPGQVPDPWATLHLEAESLYEIGRVHFHEGAPDAAREFLAKALPLAQRVETLRVPGKHIEDGLEGKIAALLIQL
jgi:hypothetical protein